MPKYLPSSFLNEIEEPLRRKPRKNYWRRNWIFWVLVVITILTLSYAVIANIVDYQAQQAAMVQRAQAAEVKPLCERYLADKKLVGTAAEETLKQICHE